jgi:hypothetical protein
MDDPIAPHEAVRPASYPSISILNGAETWPKDPPYCVVCGQEMLTVGDLEQPGQPEWHSEEALNLGGQNNG